MNSPSAEAIPETILERVRRKLAARAATPGSVLSEAEAAAFEAAHAVTLPESYRLFLTHLGNGGGGPPAYGLAALGTAPSYAGGPGENYWTRLPDVGRPFPFTRPWIWEDGDESDEGAREQISHGSLWLGTDGCGMDWHLIVTGPERGHIWWVSGEGIQPTAPKRDFGRWYEDWLDGVDPWAGDQDE